jgi:hypothetical protein
MRKFILFKRNFKTSTSYPFTNFINILKAILQNYVRLKHFILIKMIVLQILIENFKINKIEVRFVYFLFYFLKRILFRVLIFKNLINNFNSNNKMRFVFLVHIKIVTNIIFVKISFLIKA